ncbi:MAG: MMPL family transporter [Planctomycetes bacterium]|jgi:preprotein translocase subunit SecD|nr:MMPL family transporter [Planctomycetota bacterium]
MLKRLFSSVKAKYRLTLVFLIIFAFAMFVVAGGEYYNKGVEYLANKTNHIIVLPKAKVLPFSLGLDLRGGTHLVYKADVSKLAEKDRDSALESARDVIERRVNAFGVSEPLIQVNKSGNEYRIIAELAGIKDVKEAIKQIGETPLLEFKEKKTDAEIKVEPVVEQENTKQAIPADKAATKKDSAIKKTTEPAIKAAVETVNTTPVSNNNSTTVEQVNSNEIPADVLAKIKEGQTASDNDNIAEQMAKELESWKNTELTGKNLKRATVQFNPQSGSPEVSLEFDGEGAKMFENITGRNIGKQVAIFLDGMPISVPTVNDKIIGGKAVISGSFDTNEAKDLAKRLNSGALPVPISLVSQQTVEASLGSVSIANSLKAGLIGLLLVSLFMIFYYRLPGVLAVLSLFFYSLLVLSIFKALPVGVALVIAIAMVGLMIYVFSELKLFNEALSLLFIGIGIFVFIYALKAVTLTLSGVAGFILSLGMAVDANILIFERIKEEIKSGKDLLVAIDNGFKRAWSSIRDGNLSTILTCLVLMFFGTSSVQGFGTALFLGVTVSMFSAIVVTRTLFVLISGKWMEKHTWLLGVSKKWRQTNNN